MVTSARYDTTCPNCNQTFEVEETLSEGNCPSCGVHLRFLEEAPPPPPDMPTLAPESGSAPFAEAPSEAPSNGDGGFAVQCPQCTHTFSVAAETAQGTCPRCHSQLSFEDQYPRAIESFTIQCPSCGAASDVPAEARTATCTHCGSALKLQDVFPGQESLLEPAPAAPTEPAPVASDASAKPGRGKFRRFTREPAAPKPETATAPPEPEQEASPARVAEPDPDLPPPIKGAPPGGFPYVLSCPTCQREFSVSPKEHEGNCPHCNAPLAFLTEKEYDALLEAEERKRAFQAKLQKRRLERKKRDEERLARESATAPERNLLQRLRRGKTTGAPADTPTAGAPAAAVPPPLEPPQRKWKAPWAKEETPATQWETVPASTEPAPIRVIQLPPPTPPTKRGKGKKGPTPEPAAPVVETDVAIAEAQTAPAEPEPPAKKGFLSRFSRKKAAAEPLGPAAAVESGSIEMAGIEATPPPPVPEPAQAPSRSKAGRKQAARPTPAPAAVEPAGIEMGEIEVAAAAAPEAPAKPAKAGFLSRFGRKKDAVPASAPATAEVVGVELGDIVAAAPATPAASPKKTKGAKAPAPVAVVEAPRAAIDFESSFEAPAAPAPAVPKKGFLSRFKREKTPPGPAAVVEAGEIEFANGELASPAEAGPVEVSAKAAPAPKKRRK